jgi:hypothetical protein
MGKLLADELMDEVIEEMEGGGGEIEQFCKLFEQREIDAVIGRLERMFPLHVSDSVRAEAARAMIRRLKAVDHVRTETPILKAARLHQ